MPLQNGLDGEDRAEGCSSVKGSEISVAHLTLRWICLDGRTMGATTVGTVATYL